jgi:hypothetical protein
MSSQLRSARRADAGENERLAELSRVRPSFAALGHSCRELMKLYYFRSKPNFGDLLNPFLWERLLPDTFDDDGSELFLGIGSILFAGFPQHATKIVFGSGYGGYTSRPRLDSTWYVHFVRGPQTAQALGIDPKFAIADPAILIRTIPFKRPEKRHRVSLLLHHESAELGLWHKVAEQTAIPLIDVRKPVPEVLDQILASEVVLCEAMHAAIVADALRVPWIPLLPVNPRHRAKWADWAASLQIRLRPVPLHASSVLEVLAANIRPQSAWLRRAGNRARSQLAQLLGSHTSPRPDMAERRGGIPALAERRQVFVERWSGSYFLDRAANSVLLAAREAPTLSEDKAINRVTDQMLARVDWLKRHGPRSVMPF